MKKIIQWLIGLCCLPAMTAFAEQTVTITIHTDQPRQTMDGFGASDAWSFQHIGLWPERKRAQVADWLFSTATNAKGQPLGIGLNLWRFNLGAGSAEQGKASRIWSPSNRTECLMNANGSFDWTKQQGQRLFMKMAKERGPVRFLAFLNSPPVYYTKNGLATNFGRQEGTFNLKEDKYHAFSHFIVKAIKGLAKKDGLYIDYISPVNEPDGHWNWTGTSQEGTPATNPEIARLTRILSHDLLKAGLTTKILVNESSDYRCLLGVYKTHSDRGNTLRSFFTPDSTTTFIGNLPNLLPLIGAHSYWTNTPIDSLRRVRERLGRELAQLGKGFWQTETCIMGNDEEIGYGGGYDRTMKTALYVARVIHHDIALANARSWQWWRAVGGDYKDGLLRAYDVADTTRCRVEDSKLLWALGNYSFFIKPGAVRYTASIQGERGGDTNPVGLMVTAFRNPDGRWTTVVINYADEEKTLRLAFTGSTSVNRWQEYRTSALNDEHISPIATFSGNDTCRILPRCIVTFISAEESTLSLYSNKR